MTKFRAGVGSPLRKTFGFADRSTWIACSSVSCTCAGPSGSSSCALPRTTTPPGVRPLDLVHFKRYPGRAVQRHQLLTHGAPHVDPAVRIHVVDGHELHLIPQHVRKPAYTVAAQEPLGLLQREIAPFALRHLAHGSSISELTLAC